MERIVLIVEGFGEVEAAPILFKRVINQINPLLYLEIPRPIRIPTSRLKRPGELERVIKLAATKIVGRGGIFILTDCDWPNSCPARDAPILLKRAHRVRTDIPISIVMANKEYEAWFIASADSLRGHRDLPDDLSCPTDRDPESIRGAKEWLGNKMPHGRRYSEVLDQPALTEVFDISAARRAGSFDKCYREIERMVSEILGQEH